MIGAHVVYHPGERAIAALRTAAEAEGRAAPPAILITASGARAARAAGADAILLKPFDLDALEVLMRRFLGSAQSASNADPA